MFSNMKALLFLVFIFVGLPISGKAQTMHLDSMKRIAKLDARTFRLDERH